MQKNVKLMAEIAVAVALSTVLSYLTLFRMPQGGSINLEMLPILFIAFRWGGVPGVIAGVVHGLVQIITGAYVVHPAQFLLDYPVAYGLLGMAGFITIFRANNTIKMPAFLAALFLGVGARFVSHLLSGVIFFADLAPEGQNPWIYSAVYNITHLIPAAILSGLVILVIYRQTREVFQHQMEL